MKKLALMVFKYRQRVEYLKQEIAEWNETMQPGWTDEQEQQYHGREHLSYAETSAVSTLPVSRPR